MKHDLETPLDDGGDAGGAVADSEKRRQIINGAREVFLVKGYEGASMEAIARAAGVSKGTLYVYFTNKDELFEALIIEEKRCLAENMVPAFEGSADFETYLREAAHRISERISSPQNISSIRMVVGAAEKFPGIGDVYYRAGILRGIRKLSDVFRVAIDRGLLRDVDPEVLARHFIALCTSDILKRALFGSRTISDPGVIDGLIDDGIRAFLAAYRV